MVGQPPAPPQAERPGLLVTGVQAHLHGGGGAHHGAAGGARAVQARLHGVVARLTQETAGFVPRIVAEADEAEAAFAQNRADGVEVGGDGGDDVRQGGRGGRAQLQLAAGFHGERRPQGHGPQCGVGRFESFGCDGELRCAQFVDEPFHLDAEAAWRAGLEADAADESLDLGFGQ